MNLNELHPASGSRKNAKRVGRGIGCGNGKTCGRGHKGQKSRSGGKVAFGFEGGQTPWQRRCPKFGFKSRVSFVSQDLPLSSLSKINEDKGVKITLEVLKKHNLVKSTVKFVKVYLSGKLDKSLLLDGIKVTKGAKAEIEKNGGSVN